MYMYLYVHVDGLINSSSLVNFNFSIHMKIFLYFMFINLASSIKYVYYFLSFHLFFHGLNYIYTCVFSWSYPLQGTYILLDQTNGTCEHTFSIGDNTGGVIIDSYYFNPQYSFIKVERLGSPETSRCLFTNWMVFAPQYSKLDFNHVVLHHSAFT